MTTTKIRTATAISATAEDFATKVRTALLKSVAQGVGEVRVKVADPNDRVTVRKVQKRVQTIGYGSGFNANFRVTLTGDILTGKVQDLTRDLKRPGQTDPTAKTPGTRTTFDGWTTAKITAWKKSHPVNATGETKTPAKTTAKRTKTTKVTKRVRVAQTPPQSLSGVVSATPVDTTTVTVTKVPATT